MYEERHDQHSFYVLAWSYPNAGLFFSAQNCPLLTEVVGMKI